jgi:phage-related tail fiber protein
MAKTVFVDTPPLGTIVTAAFLNAVNNHRHTGQDVDGAGALDYAVATGSGNAYAITLAPALTAHVAGMPIVFKANHANSGASTVAVSGMGAVAIKRRDGSALVTGDIQNGQIVIICYDGTNYQLMSQHADISDVGKIGWFPTAAAPAGWLKANGAAVSRTTYANLFAVISTTFGAGNGSTTFNLPDMRGEFVRGLDDGRGVDPDRTLGSAQDDRFQTHKHAWDDTKAINADDNPPNASSGYLSGNGGSTQALFAGGTINSRQYIGAPTDNESTVRTGTETRPRNIALLACIKY